MLPAQGVIKNYHWGRTDNNSFIAKIEAEAQRQKQDLQQYYNKINNNNNQTQLHDTKLPRAELWFGSHPSGPSSVLINNKCIKLDVLFRDKPEFCSSVNLLKSYKHSLPYLFKVLSISQPLSLQAHPNKDLAKQLHIRDPKNYPDDNHKPELAIALTKFEVLFDFRPFNEILNFLADFEHLRLAVGEKNHHRFVSNPTSCENLIQCFKGLMDCDRQVINKEVSSLISNVGSACKLSTDLLRLVAKLHSLYPGDPGCFAPFFLNYLTLEPGQAIFLEANKLHAYIEGECIECMACSDNVVRAGLTCKFCDVDTLMRMLSCDQVSPKRSELVLAPKISAITERTHQQNKQFTEFGEIQTFSASQEFSVDKIIIDGSKSFSRNFTLKPKNSGSFVLVFSGKANANDFIDPKLKHKLISGSVAFVPPQVDLKLSEIQGNLILYQAYC